MATIQDWLKTHLSELREHRQIASQATYKNVSQAILLKLIVDTPEGIAVTGHGNEEINSNLRAKRP